MLPTNIGRDFNVYLDILNYTDESIFVKSNKIKDWYMRIKPGLINSDFPQGSVQGPVSFISDIPATANIKLTTYADAYAFFQSMKIQK